VLAAGCSSALTTWVSAVPEVVQRGTEPGDLDIARLARMGGFGLLFYGPYQCAARQTTPVTGRVTVERCRCTGRALQVSHRRCPTGSTGTARWTASSPPGAYPTSSPR